MKIVLLYAMQAEADPFLRTHAAVELPTPGASWLPFRLFRCECPGLELLAMVSGVDARHDVDNIGLEAATLMAYVAIQELRPDLLLSCGTAGGFADLGARIGRVYLADTFLFHDRHVPLPGFDRSGVSKTRTYQAAALADALGLSCVTVSSGSSLRRSEDDLAVLREHDAQAKEMEAAAIAWVSQLAGVPFLAVKSITNLLDEADSSEVQFRRHFATAVAALAEQTARVLAAFVPARPGGPVRSAD